jgi:hypothetical protein
MVQRYLCTPTDRKTTYAAKTCRKLGIIFWNYLGDRLDVAGSLAIRPLADLVRAQGQTT